MRAAGILLPIFSLPTKYGIGGFSREAYEFVDFLKAAHQSYWQILPLGPTGYGDSPYQTFSTFAGNPYYISLEKLCREGLLSTKECFVKGANKGPVDYGKIYKTRFKILRKAFERSDHTKSRSYRAFVKENALWLNDYCLFMAIKERKNGAGFNLWEEDIRFRKREALKKYEKELSSEIEFQKFLQYKFYQQYAELKAYANKNGVKIIGDIPIYVSPDSSDLWASPKLFQLDKKGNMKAVAGCPPDAFSETGQLWGNPLYDWTYHEKTGYEWWIKRMEHCMKLYDVIRIDHFRGFEKYYSIPYGSNDARGGKWEKGPGLKLFKEMKKRLENVDVIAEDLGLITPAVRRLVKATGFPNMKVLEFAFDPDDHNGAGEYLPHNYSGNCVVYTGTHDNETLYGWLKGLKGPAKRMVADYVGEKSTNALKLGEGLIRVAMMSVADYCIIPMQDHLCLDNTARINFPSTLGGNWAWRMEKGMLNAELAERLAALTDRYGRGSGQ